MATIILPVGSTMNDLQTTINNISSGDIIEISNNMLFSGTVTIPNPKTVTIQSIENNNWVLTQTVSQIRHFIINGNGGVVLQNITLDGGEIGGGIQISENGSLTINTGAIVQNCYTKDNGAGIFVPKDRAIVTLNGGTVTNNNAAGDGTGSTAVGNGGGIYSNSNVTINSGTISNNKAAQSGGGIDLNSLTLLMNNGTITNNTATSGGGANVTWGTFTLVNGNITSNNASQGGGVYLNDATMNINGGFISGNVATSYGGGINIYNSSKVTMNNGTINSNSSPNGGGTCVGTNSGFTLNNGLITENMGASGAGVQVNSNSVFNQEGGIINKNSSSNQGGGVYVNNCTFNMQGGIVSDNTALNQGGGVMMNNGTLNVGNAVIENNTATNRNGGGIYLSDAAQLTVTKPTSITNNSAPKGHGGGIYTANMTYSNISTSEDTAFSKNKSVAIYEPPVNASILYPDIKFASTSVLNHPLNDYDINYQSGSLLVYNITYNANGGTGSYTGPNIVPGNNDTVLSALTTGINYENHIFESWNTAPNGSGTKYDPGDTIIMLDNVTFYAQWSSNIYTVEFNSNGGTLVENQMVPGGGKVRKPANPKKTGYAFIGWYTDDGTFKNAWDFNNDVVTNNMTLYANWKTITPRDRAIIDLIESVALQETALSHILNAEGEKIQAMLKIDGITYEELLLLNKKATKLVSSITNLEIIFQSKLNLLKE